MRVYLVDDETDGLETMKWNLSRIGGIEVVGCHTLPEKALLEIADYKPDVLFTDIQMPGITGFDLVEKLPNPKPLVVFVTAYNHFAIKAIKFSAIDYLVKPVDFSELQETIIRCREKLQTNSQLLQANLASLLQNIQSQKSKQTQLAVPTSQGVEIIEIPEIVRCKADNNYTEVHTVNGSKLVVSKTLKEFEDVLPQDTFKRVHKSHLVNQSFIKKIMKTDALLILKDGTEVPYSKEKKDSFIDNFLIIKGNNFSFF